MSIEQFNFSFSSRIWAVLQPGLLVSGLTEAQSLDWVKASFATTPSARIGAAMAYDAAAHITVLFGGNGSAGIFGDETVPVYLDNPRLLLGTATTNSTGSFSGAGASRVTVSFRHAGGN